MTQLDLPMLVEHDRPLRVANCRVLYDAVVPWRNLDHLVGSKRDSLMVLSRERARSDHDTRDVEVVVEDMDVCEGCQAVNRVLLRHSLR